MKAKVYVQFPKAGLGNKMLTWSRAYVFAQLNGLEMHTSSWFSFFWGAWIRRENKSRIYVGYFKSAGLTVSLRFLLYPLLLKKVEEPELQKLIPQPTQTLFIFNKTYRTYDFFKEVRPYKTLLREGILNILTPTVKAHYIAASKPEIGVHVRRGDFKISNTITPVTFFVEVINEIRKQVDSELPVTVFTDADDDEVQDLLKMPHVKLAEKNPDIVDILLLSDSKYLLTSISSTFSYWAGFLSEGVIIKPAEEWQAPLRAESDPLAAKEIKWSGVPVSADTVDVLRSFSINQSLSEA